MQEFVADLRFRHQAVWRAIEGHDLRGQPSKLTAYQAWFASPFVKNARSAARVPRYLHLDLSKHVVRSIGRFRLRAHTLKVESGLWGAMYEHLRVVPPGKRLRVPSCTRPEILGSG